MSTHALVSPVSVTDGAVTHDVDFIRPQLRSTGLRRIVLHAGVQINGAPHLGTNVMQTSAFLLAAAARDRFGVDVGLRFGALDNAPFETRASPRTGAVYQRSFHHALGATEVERLTRHFYGDLFETLSAVTGVPYEIETYTAQQAQRAFREEFLASLAKMDRLRWVLAPSHGNAPTSHPCPRCGWSEKSGDHTELLAADLHRASFSAVCVDHGRFEVDVTPESPAYIGLTTLHRNLVKERVAARDAAALPVIVKGADWATGCRLLDEAFMTWSGSVPPPRIFTPVVLSDSGAKLSKTLINAGTADLSAETEPWMLDATKWNGTVPRYAQTLVGLVSLMLSDPRHFERGYTTREVARLISRGDISTMTTASGGSRS
ncbi:hypothetical protein SMC26_15935 [Actinomadura fulvescens]|uniref:Uncharacterized protein n=1 Tax=Actinomadura fulvescens TaxID=46160 RepID=A0ABN3QW11_9ACTN